MTPRMRDLLFCGVVLSLALVAPARAAGVDGTWSGTFDILFADGRVLRDTAWLVLEQRDASLSGTVGPRAEEQAPILDAKISAGEISFAAPSTPGKQLRFRLQLVGDRLRGNAVGDIGEDRVYVDVSAVRPGQPGNPAREALFQRVQALDTQLFDAFNRRDVPALMALFTPDLEFYHDRHGVTTHADTERNFRELLGGTTRVRRELIPGTLEVMALGEYGALQTGRHRFFVTEPGAAERPGATALFAHVWQNKDGKWQLRRVISFDHH